MTRSTGQVAASSVVSSTSQSAARRCLSVAVPPRFLAFWSIARPALGGAAGRAAHEDQPARVPAVARPGQRHRQVEPVRQARQAQHAVQGHPCPGGIAQGTAAQPVADDQVGTLAPDRGHAAVPGVAAVGQHDGAGRRREPVEALGPAAVGQHEAAEPGRQPARAWHGCARPPPCAAPASPGWWHPRSAPAAPARPARAPPRRAVPPGSRPASLPSAAAGRAAPRPTARATPRRRRPSGRRPQGHGRVGVDQRQAQQRLGRRHPARPHLRPAPCPPDRARPAVAPADPTSPDVDGPMRAG